MTQDCSDSPSTADVSKRLPKGIHVIGAERLSDPSTKQPYFIHKTLRYSYKDEEKQQGVKKIW